MRPLLWCRTLCTRSHSCTAMLLTLPCSDFWAYFEPIRQNMPKNCSADVQAAIAHVDSVFTSGSTNAIASLKATFGLEDVKHLDDAAGAREFVLYESRVTVD